MSRQLPGGLLLCAIALAFSLALAELGVRGLGLMADERTVLAELGESPVEHAPERAISAEIHPFLGWSRRPGVTLKFGSEDIDPFPGGAPTEWSRRNARTNLLGFFSSIDDYRELAPSDLVIGIFGGSVASSLAVLGGGALRDELARRFARPAESIAILNFGSGGYKQPQQVIALLEAALLRVPLDVVVNVDGFNEVVLGGADARSGHHPLLPSRRHHHEAVDLSLRDLSGEGLELAAGIARERRLAGEIAAASGGLFGRSELVRGIAGYRARRHLDRAIALEDRLQELSAREPQSPLASLPDRCLGGTEGCPELIADLWEASSRAMHALAEEFGADYLHVLQPNQYVTGSKTLSDEERKLAYLRSSRSRSIERGYPLLQQRGARLRGRGIAFEDLTLVFADEAGTIYRDSCCHYNLRGNEILARAIGRRLRLVEGTSDISPRGRTSR